MLPRACALILGIACAWPAAASAAPLQLERVGTFSAPVFVTAPRTDSSRLFVVEQQGRIQIVVGGVKRQFLDLTNVVSASAGERGLGSMAFAPDYETSGRFYVQYTAQDPVGAVTIAEYRRSATDPDAADPGSGRVVLSIPHDQDPDHDGGQLQFGPDGALYSSVGDGGGAGGDPAGNGQNLTSSTPPVVNGANHHPLLGKILRIDPRSGSPYTVPAGNPFPAPAREVYAYGLRNPWRFSFDRLTGDLVVTDVGQDEYEEVNFAAAPGRGLGANYGWNPYEGLHTYPGGALVTPPFPAGFTFPVLEKSHAGDGFCSIIGGYVVRDPGLPELAGQYVYGDFCNSALRAVSLTASGPSNDHAIGLTATRITSFGEDACARVYVTSIGGAVDRITNGTPSSCTVPVPGVPTVSVSDVGTPEGDSGSAPASFVVSLSGASSDTVTVHQATTDGTATAPADYTSTSSDVTFAPGQTSKTVDVPVRGDQLDEDDETFSVDLSSPTNATIADGHGVGTIADDDPAPAISIADVRVPEGDAGLTTAAFEFSLSAPSEKAISVPYATADGSALAPGDYRAGSGTVTLAPRQGTARVEVPIAGDTVDEDDQTFVVRLGTPVGASVGRGEATATIVDDDAPPTVAIDDARLSEGDAGTAPMQFVVSLSAASEKTVTVRFATSDGSARAASDYARATGDVSFAPGETRRAVSVGVVGDKVPELNESLTLGVSGGAKGTGTILDDDPAVEPLQAAKSVRLGDLFCRSDRRCPGVSVGATYASAGTGTWTFDSRDGRHRVMLGRTRVTRRAAGRARAVFQLRPGRRTAALRRRVLAQRNPILHATLSFRATSGQRSKVELRMRLRR
jgi:Glucose / Sorbosone dehydrogenase/Calx-beta domain